MQMSDPMTVGPTRSRRAYQNAHAAGEKPENDHSGKTARASSSTRPEREKAGISDLFEYGADSVFARIRSSVQESFTDGAHELTFQAFGTRCRVVFAAPAPRAPELKLLVMEWVAAFEAKYSRFLPGSLISRINSAAGREPVPLDSETEQLFALCDQMHFITQGVFDPTALPLLHLWNWKAEPPVIPTEEKIAAALKLVGWRKIQRSSGCIFLPQAGMGLDLGGMGKEFAVDRVAQLLNAAGATSVLVDFGADVRAIGLPPDGRPAWHIGLDDPRQPGRCWCGLGLREGAVATSGDYVRRFVVNGRRYGHILDVRTGYPVDNGCQAVSVLAPSCTLAGMLSTAAFVLGPDAGMKLLEAQFGAAGAIITEHRTLPSRHFYEHVVS
jgi:thiamine biosynthesis lipoprotein